MVFHKTAPKTADKCEPLRLRMVRNQIVRRGVRDTRVLGAMERVPRHCFVPGIQADDAYVDAPLPTGCGQTISQPYIVGFMVEALELPDGARVLEIGTGTGYQAAVLSEAGFRVFTVEIIPELALRAGENLARLGYSEVRVRCADGNPGWPEEAPFDGIIVAAAPPEVPQSLLEQLAMGGSLVIPVGVADQELWHYRRVHDGFEKRRLLSVRFVPMTGKKK